MEWNYLSNPKLKRLHHWSLGTNTGFHPTFCNGCNHLLMLGLKIWHVSKMRPKWHITQWYCTLYTITAVRWYTYEAKIMSSLCDNLQGMILIIVLTACWRHDNAFTPTSSTITSILRDGLLWEMLIFDPGLFTMGCRVMFVVSERTSVSCVWGPVPRVGSHPRTLTQ